MEYLIPIWWPSVSKIVQKHRDSEQLRLFVRGSNSN